MTAQKAAKRAPTPSSRDRRPTPKSTPSGKPPLWVWGGAAVVGVVIVVALLLVRGSPGSGGASATSGGFVGPDLHSVMVNPANPRQVFVGGHASAAVSNDAGRTFEQISGLQNADAMSWSIAPDGRTQVVSGHYGLRVSADGGTQWRDRTASMPRSDVHAVGLDPTSPTHLVAYLVGAGIYASADMGQSWNHVGGDNLSLMGPILVSPGGQQLIATDMMSGIVQSRDGGANWSVLSAGVQASWLARDPANAQHLLIAGNGVAQSTDGGATWQQVPSPPGNVTAITMSGGAPPTLYAAELDGQHAVVFASTDQGQHWQQATAP